MTTDVWVEDAGVKKCRICKASFEPYQSFQTWCCVEHGLIIAQAKVAKIKKAKVLVEKREHKAKLDKLKTRAQWLKEAKAAIQGARRLEELAMGSGCMSCGRSQAQVMVVNAWSRGGLWDGGHFLGKGAHPELALEPMNIWLQCKPCNAGSGKYARKGQTVNVSFRANLIDRIGLEAVEAMESDHRPRHYTIDDLKAIKALYSSKILQLKKAAQN